MVAGLGFGISSFVYEVNDSRISRASGRGPNVELCLQPRFAFGRHVGAYLLLSYHRLNYSTLSFEDQLTYLPDALALEGAGTAFGVGMFFRFGTK